MKSSEDLKKSVRNHYTGIANTASSCCGGVCGCSSDVTFAESYAGREGYVPEADLGLGCGIPTDIADLKPGETVVDLGSGAGNDCFVARRYVGETGRVIGIDFTPAMLRKAKENAEKLKYTNVEFLKGEIENILLPEGVADVVVSNCVLNLVPDKRRAFVEMHRILKPGGRFAVSDIVLNGHLPESIRDVAQLYAGCVSGAIEKSEYLTLLRATGFTEVEVRKERDLEMPDEFLREHLSEENIVAFRKSGARILSVTVSGRK